MPNSKLLDTRESRKLEQLSHEELLSTVRHLLVEADTLSSRIAAVSEIGIAINRNLEIDQILRVVAKQAKWLLDFDYCGACLRDANQLWRIIDLFGESDTGTLGDIANARHLNEALKTGHAYLGHQAGDTGFLHEHESRIILPMMSDKQVIGAIVFALRAAQRYSQEDLRIGHLLTLQVAAAVRNARSLLELQQAEQSLRTYAQELETRNRELDAFAHTIAHDLKTPLTRIPMRVGMIEYSQPDMNANTRRHLREIETATLQMKDMIDQLLMLARLHNPIEAAVEVNANTVVAAALSRMGDRLQAGGFEVDVTSDMPAALAHEQWLEEVFANLISNAVKYIGADNPAPHITIRGICSGELVTYEVEDNGLGIPEDKQAQLFEMFTRLHPDKAEGVGLGLSIVYRIVANLGGQIGVRSVEGVGSTFWFSLPSACD